MSRTRAILARRNVGILSEFARSNVLLAFDYDGTLAPLAPTPARARMRARTQDLLVRVSRRYPCVVISGRVLADITQRVKGIPLGYVFGNHGLEPAPAETSTTNRAPRIPSGLSVGLSFRNEVTSDIGFAHAAFYRHCGFQEAGRATYRKVPLVYFELLF